jgi:Na+/H+-translocating membrane pyrophosphatase
MQFGLTLKMELLLLSRAHRAEIDDGGEILVTFDIIASYWSLFKRCLGGAYTPGRHGGAAQLVGITTAPFHMI